MQDTFLDAAHVKESFPSNEVEVQNGTEQAEPQRPFKVTFAQPLAKAQADSKVMIPHLYLVLRLPFRTVCPLTPTPPSHSLLAPLASCSQPGPHAL